MIFTNTYQYTKYHPALSSLHQVHNLMKSPADNMNNGLANLPIFLSPQREIEREREWGELINHKLNVFRICPLRPSVPLSHHNLILLTDFWTCHIFLLIKCFRFQTEICWSPPHQVSGNVIYKQLSQASNVPSADRGEGRERYREVWAAS